MLLGLRVAAVFALAVLAIVPTHWLEHGPSLCLVKMFFGRECLGCGMTRALSALMHGDVGAAMSFNRGSIAVLPLFVLTALSGRLPSVFKIAVR